jgi:hypothetical protein
MHSQRIIEHLQSLKNEHRLLYLVKIPTQYTTTLDVKNISENEKWIGPLTENMKCDYFQKFKLPGNERVKTYKIDLVSKSLKVLENKDLSCYCIKQNEKIVGLFESRRDVFEYVIKNNYENVKIIHAVFQNDHYASLFENKGKYNIKDVPMGVCVGCKYVQKEPAKEGYWICGMNTTWACFDCKYGRKGSKAIPSRAFACERCTSSDVTWYQGGGYDCHRCKNLGLN